MHAVVVASRGAMNYFWDKIRNGYDGCAVTSEPSTCLSDVVHLNLREDARERSRFHVMQRHFSRYKEQDHSHTVMGYDDGAQALSMVSDSLISLHNLTAEDFRIFDLLLNRIRVAPK
ncbi:hypothetical protein COOONC_11604 [Cooperia oncophora]